MPAGGGCRRAGCGLMCRRSAPRRPLVRADRRHLGGLYRAWPTAPWRNAAGVVGGLHSPNRLALSAIFDFVAGPQSTDGAEVASLPCCVDRPETLCFCRRRGAFAARRGARAGCWAPTGLPAPWISRGLAAYLAGGDAACCDHPSVHRIPATMLISQPATLRSKIDLGAPAAEVFSQRSHRPSCSGRGWGRQRASASWVDKSRGAGAKIFRRRKLTPPLHGAALDRATSLIIENSTSRGDGCYGRG